MSENSQTEHDTRQDSGSETAQDGGPLGSGDYVVRPGDCISSIAADRGLFWETIWNDPANAELKTRRVDPNILLPGDRVTVPPLRLKQESGATEQLHRFRRKGVPVYLRLRLLETSNPQAGVDYILDIDGSLSNGTTDGEGRIEVSIRPNARRGKLTLLLGDTTQVYTLALGHIDPVSELSGAQNRLHDLGYEVGPLDGQMGPLTEAALRAFQTDNDLPVCGRLDAATAAKLQEVFGG